MLWIPIGLAFIRNAKTRHEKWYIPTDWHTWNSIVASDLWCHADVLYAKEYEKSVCQNRMEDVRPHIEPDLFGF